MAISVSSLRQASNRSSVALANTSMEARSRGIRTAFLCHSHRDRDLVMGFVRMLQDSGWWIYVDWEDNSMPSTPSQETARKIRDRIMRFDYFIFLATENAMASRWCPWELGCADGKKSNDRILVVPTKEHGREHGNEYIGLYRRLDTNSLGHIEVFNPGSSYGAAVRSL